MTLGNTTAKMIRVEARDEIGRFSAFCANHSANLLQKARHRLGRPRLSLSFLNRSKSIRKHGHLVAGVGGTQHVLRDRAQENDRRFASPVSVS